MPKITNKAPGPVSVYVGGVSMAVPPGEFIESDDFTEGELKFYGAHPEQFEVSGKAVEGGTDQVELEKGRAASATLAGIVSLFGTDEVDELNVKSAVERLIQETKAKNTAPVIAASKPETVDTGKVGSDTDLAEAVALLDDANDDHWTQAGKPDISALKALVGGDVTRAQVDALPVQRERAKA